MTTAELDAGIELKHEDVVALRRRLRHRAASLRFRASLILVGILVFIVAGISIFLLAGQITKFELSTPQVTLGIEG